MVRPEVARRSKTKKYVVPTAMHGACGLPTKKWSVTSNYSLHLSAIKSRRPNYTRGNYLALPVRATAAEPAQGTATLAIPVAPLPPLSSNRQTRKLLTWYRPSQLKVLQRVPNLCGEPRPRSFSSGPGSG